MMLPSYETYKRMVGAHGGVWPELVNDGSIELAIKLSADLTKAVLKGAPVTLVVAVIRAADKNVRVVGVRIEDDKNDPAFIHGPQGKAKDQEHFDKLLNAESTFVTFFDELVRPVMAGRVLWNSQNARIVLNNLERTKPHYQGDHRPLLIEAMDTAQEGIPKWHRNDGSAEANLWKAIPLQFENLHPINVSSAEAGTFRVDDLDEGGGLEKSAYLLLEANYPGTAHLNPQFDDGPKRREFCDVLVVGKEELLIIQSKVMAILERKPRQTTYRRVANVYSNFQKAVGQLNGSVRVLRQGKAIYTRDGVEISIDLGAIKMIHGIVLLSSTNLSLPWKNVSQELIAASRKAKAGFHVLEFGELQQHVAFGKTLSEMSMHLRGRFEVAEKSGNANIKARFLNEENRPIASAPIDDDAYGYVFTLEIDSGRRTDAARIFKIFKAALKRREFTGRCEYFQDIGLLEGEKFCWIGLGLHWQREVNPIPSYDWWLEFREEVRPQLKAEPGLELTHLSEMATLGEIRGVLRCFRWN
ncbi:MAG: hypothetical protein IH623_13590 [Verrucomicrobia bacterium]|nr:hypothetical protein [Verrucomicrobiota bacterium]